MQSPSSKKIFTTAFTIFVLALLVISGPANAIDITLTNPNKDVTRGDIPYFIAKIEPTNSK